MKDIYNIKIGDTEASVFKKLGTNYTVLLMPNNIREYTWMQEINFTIKIRMLNGEVLSKKIDRKA